MKHFHCPVNGWDCPYYVDRQNLGEEEDEYCLCGMGFEGFNPYEECSDFLKYTGKTARQRNILMIRRNKK